jgi:hydrogenase nickel incorporation protein HypA/HybF
MHEYSIVQALLEQVDAQAAAHGASSVHGLSVRIGELAGVEADLLRVAFETFAEQTICEGARLEIVDVPARWCCNRCGRGLARSAVLRCPDCNVPATLSSGDEIVLESIEMEVSHV